MNLFSKKTIVGLVAGAIIATGVAIPLLAQASFHKGDGHACRQQQVEPAKMAQHMSERFSVSQETVLKYQNDGVKFRDIRHAAFLAKVSGKDLEQVMNLKTKDNNWRDVSKEQVKATHQNMIAASLHDRAGIDQQTAQDLLQQGYHPRDIGMAAKLSNESGKPLSEVLGLKKINNTWRDVAVSLGISATDFKQYGKHAHHRGMKAEMESR